MLMMLSCKNETTNQVEKELLYTEIKPTPSKVDSIIVGKPLPFNTPDTLFFSDLKTYQLTTDTIPLKISNVRPEKNTIVFPPKKVDTTFKIIPDTFEIQPFIAYVSHPKPFRAGEMRSTKTGGENIQYLDVEQGLASSQVNCIAEDPFGFLWFGLSNGLTRYDGNYITHYTTENGLPHNYIDEIFFDSSQTMWLTTRAGLVNYDGIKMKIYNKQSGLDQSAILDVEQDLEGNIWFVVAEGGLIKLEGNKAIHYNAKNGLKQSPIIRIAVDRRGRIFISYFAAAPEYLDQDNTVSRYHYAWDFFGSDIQNKVYRDKNQNLWLANYSGGACRISENDTAVRYLPETGISYRSLNDIEEDHKGRMWFGSIEAGVAYYENGKYISYTTDQGLTSNYVTDLHQDKAGNMWVATLGGGVNKIKPESFRIYNQTDGLSDKNVSAIHVNSNGDVIFGTWADGPWIFDDSLFYHISNHVNGVIVFDMEEDYFGNTIVGAHQHGTYSLKPFGGDSVSYSSMQNLNDYLSLRPWGVRKIIRDTDDNLWLLDDTHGLFRFILSEDKTHYEYCLRNSTENGLNSNMLYYGAIDSTGLIWFLQVGMGISSVKNDSITNYTTKNGLISNNVRTMYVDSKNRLWLGTDKGINILEKGIFVSITTKDNLSSNYISNFVEDAKGRMWVGTQNGLNLLLEDSSKECGFAITDFGIKDGLRSTEFMTNCAIIDQKNNAWWATRNGLVKLNLDVFDKKYTRPIIKIIDVELMHQSINFGALKDSIEKNAGFFLADSATDISGIKFNNVEDYFNLPQELVLPYNLNSIGFHFSTLNGLSSHEIEYRHRLKGYEDKWSEWTSSPSVNFDNLPHGKFSLELESRIINREEVDSIIYHFEILPPFWKTWWFRILVFVLAFGLIYLIFKWRNRALIERQLQLEETVNERTQEIKHQKTLIEQKQIEILDSINYAHRIQRALLATDEMLKKNLPEHFIFFKPKDIVSGDFYWAAEIDDHQFLLITADSTGHGVPGAIMSMLNISALEKAVESDKLFEPSEILNSARKKIITTLAKDGSIEGGKDGMDCSLIRFDFKKMELSFAGANNGIWIYRNGKLLEFEPDRMPVGKHLRDKTPFNQIEIPLFKDDLIFMFTDGFADQFGGDVNDNKKPGGKKFKYKSLKKVLVENASLSMQDQKEKLENVLTTWQGDLEQVDDVCVLGVRV